MASKLKLEKHNKNRWTTLRYRLIDRFPSKSTSEYDNATDWIWSLVAYWQKEDEDAQNTTAEIVKKLVRAKSTFKFSTELNDPIDNKVKGHKKCPKVKYVKKPKIGTNGQKAKKGR